MSLRNFQVRKISLGSPTPGAKELPVHLISQKESNWCWAACAKMVMSYYGETSVKQCDLANWLFQRSDCGDASSSPNCNRTCRVGDVSKVYTNWNIHSILSRHPVSPSELQGEINLGQPVEVAFIWNGGLHGHVVLVTGWYPEPQEIWFKVLDPGEGVKKISYSYLLTAYGKGSWDYTWTGLRK